MFIICILSDEKYQHFQDVLTTYIEKHFSAALAHKYVKHNSDYCLACEQAPGECHFFPPQTALATLRSPRSLASFFRPMTQSGAWSQASYCLLKLKAFLKGLCFENYLRSRNHLRSLPCLMQIVILSKNLNYDYLGWVRLYFLDTWSTYSSVLHVLLD